MTKKSFFFSFFAIALIIAGVSFSFNSHTDSSEKDAIRLHSLMQGLDRLHYAPQKVNNDFSQKVYTEYLKGLDSGKRFFTQVEINQFTPFDKSLDEAIDEANFEFFDLSVKVLDNAVDRTEKFYNEIMKEDFDYSFDETVELDGDKRAYPKDEAAQKEFWRKLLKYETLSRLENKITKQNKETLEEGEKEMTFYEMEAEAKEEVKEVFDRWFDRLQKLSRKDHMSTYLNAITSVYDPHTSYYEPVEKDNFDINMSGKLEGIGARLQTDGDATKITDIITGGPAWKQGELEVNDRIYKVAQDGEEAVDISGMLINEVVQLIRGKKGTRVNLYVKKQDGTEEIITIERDVVILEEGYAKSAILNHENVDAGKVGYIFLPRFYADFDDPNGRSSYRDVKKEVTKLKEAGVSAIILDLRDNGGGSLRDVVDMSGIFIEEGPIVQVKGRDVPTRVLEDDDDGEVIYDGDLIIMVNNYSASASEILAAALQDYDRALVVGSNATFGKGTVQRFLDLDRLVRGKGDIKPLGSVKMTIQKFYRINGGTTQLRGVTPDIILPDSYQDIKIGEREYENALEWSEISPAKYKQNVNIINNENYLQKKSSERVSQHPQFQLINENAKRFKRARDNSEYPLNLDTYKAEEAAKDKEAKKYENLLKDNVAGLTVSNLDTDLSFIEEDKARTARNKEWINELSKDIYLEEVLYIIQDMKSN